VRDVIRYATMYHSDDDDPESWLDRISRRFREDPQFTERVGWPVLWIFYWIFCAIALWPE